MPYRKIRKIFATLSQRLNRAARVLTYSHTFCLNLIAFHNADNFYFLSSFSGYYWKRSNIYMTKKIIFSRNTF